VEVVAMQIPTMMGPLARCPGCGSAQLRAVDDGDDTNFVCLSCLACWHVELGFVRLVAPATCPGCLLHDACVAAARYRVEEGAVT
jgi:hypothetical protein